MELSRYGRVYLHWPIAGLADGETPDLKAGPADWRQLELADGYTPPVGTVVPVGGVWYRALFAGPLATSNPVGTIVVTEAIRVLFRAASNPEIVVADPDWVTLTD